ncbi:pantoate--beta-alanine ligase [Caulobacter vibrioides]|uniref:pantoate--beta-alanine ligase n=1 Tax=Caulobacter vibrioides TaxID=155892 RepID=UPI000BB4699A|nr:pantoate--beta-alanine ligase [Caulobacter vibrioides]ATC25119.1 pantoate--beta-alanine ligase [Caulobacter vibrioides]AZH13269.1 pantoate--beta-alanine ligase [Caulobacter vibrioides]PLR09898.1 pantoate--beta-alanine ligase [Caulobacter vibrioides]
MTSPIIVRTVAEMREHVRAWKAAGQRVAVVPTMGALHEGHLSLVRLAQQHAQRVITTVFVNPKQFAPHEDFDAYPRGEAADAEKLALVGCDLLFAPNATEMYAPGFSTLVSVSGVSEPLEGAARPQFFGGVATVVAKLFIQSQADVAVFGEKDYQQLQVVRRMARDLDIPVEIIGAPTARAEDGLALSSRNAYLSAEERAAAVALPTAMKAAAAAVAQGGAIEDAERSAVAALQAAGFGQVDYVEVREASDLTRLGPGPIGEASGRILVAAWLGKTRLIDNMAVG